MLDCILSNKKVSPPLMKNKEYINVKQFKAHNVINLERHKIKVQKVTWLDAA